MQSGDLELFVNPRGRPGARPVVFVPGTMAWSGAFLPLAERVADAGFYSVPIDLPPFGYAERPPDGRYGRGAQAARIGALLDALDLRDVVIVGHSFGGGAAAEVAFTRQDRVTTLVLLDPAIGLGDPGPSGLLALVLGTAPARELLLAATLTNPQFVGTGLRSMIHDPTDATTEHIAVFQRPLTIARTTPEVGRWLGAGLYADTLGDQTGTANGWSAYPRPVLLLWGKEDTVTPLAQGQALAALLPHAQLDVLEGVGHVPHVEDLDATAAHVIAFLATAR